MRAAPPTDAPLADGRIERVLIAIVYSLVFAVAGYWLAAHLAAPQAWRLALLMAVAGLAMGALVARRLLPAAAARLRWTGRRWLWAGPAGTASTGIRCSRVDLQLDGGAWLLLRLYPEAGRPRWAVAHAATAGAAWHGLRLALQAHAGEGRDAPEDVAP